jgi:putative ABC transport system substrate-binding protein
MKRRAFLTINVGILAAPLATAQQGATVRRIGVIAGTRSPMTDSFWAAFVAELQEHGWIEFRNIVIERRYTEPRKESALAAAEQLVRSGVEAIVVGSTVAALAAKQVTGTLPIVMAAAADPLAVGLVASLARPGGNVTGLSLLMTELAVKQLALLNEAVIGLTSVALLANPTNASHSPRIEAVVATGRALKLQVDVVEAGSRDQLAEAFRTVEKRRFGAVLVMNDPLYNVEASTLIRLAAEHRLPVMHFNREAVLAGGFISYGASFTDMFRRAAGYVDKILKGAKPADLPVEQPTKFELAINLQTAKALGITIPQSLLLRADEVIE